MWSNNKQSDSPNPSRRSRRLINHRNRPRRMAQAGSGPVVVPLQRSDGAKPGDPGTGIDGEGPDFGRRRSAN